MTAGVLTLNIPGTTQLLSVDCDVVTSVNEEVSTSLTTVPIVTFKADQSFVFDTGVTATMTFSMVRNNPLSINDGSDNPYKWSNRKFEKMITDFIDRWQAETDGCHLVFTPIDDTFQRTIDEYVYLSSLTLTNKGGYADTLYITLNVVVGTMTAKIKPTIPVDSKVKGYQDKIYISDSFITMTSSSGEDHYFIYYGGADTLNCVSSYYVKCGPEQPFPSLVMTISKKNLSAIAPLLVDDIIAGKNRVQVKGIGGGDYIVTKVSSQGQNYKVTAYTIYEQYSASSIGEEFTFGPSANQMYHKPMEIITRILTDSETYGISGARISFALSDIVYCYASTKNSWSGDSSFSAGSDAWYVLSVCALKLGCKIWFANGKAYVVDTSVTDISSAQGIETSANFAFIDISSLCLNMSGYFPQEPSATDINFSKSVCGDTMLGDEGSETLKNYTLVVCNENNSTVEGASSEIVNQSRAKFGVRKEEYYIPEFKNDDAKAVAANTNERYCDSEQSIGFNLAEVHYDNESGRTGKYWQPYFSFLTRVGSIRDYSKDLVISNRSNFPVNGSFIEMKNKLTLSTAEYHFPEGYTEYWFGIMKPTTLTQNTSVINNIVYNG